MAKIYKFPDSTQRALKRQPSKIGDAKVSVQQINSASLESFVERFKNGDMQKAGLILSSLLGVAPNIGIHGASVLKKKQEKSPEIWEEFLELISQPNEKRNINDVLYFFGENLQLDGVDSINAYLHLRDNGPKSTGS